jgi:large subunit ribosomal protein L31
VDTEGQVERFYRKLEARQHHVDKLDDRGTAVASSVVELSELELTPRALASLARVEITQVKHVVAELESGGEAALLSIAGFGRKSMIDLKKAMRVRGYELPGEGPVAEN